MRKVDTGISVEHLKISFVDDAQPITHWLEMEMQQWVKEKHGEDVNVKLVNLNNQRNAS